MRPAAASAGPSRCGGHDNIVKQARVERQVEDDAYASGDEQLLEAPLPQHLPDVHRSGGSTPIDDSPRRSYDPTARVHLGLPRLDGQTATLTHDASCRTASPYRKSGE